MMSVFGIMAMISSTLRRPMIAVPMTLIKSRSRISPKIWISRRQRLRMKMREDLLETPKSFKNMKIDYDLSHGRPLAQQMNLSSRVGSSVQNLHKVLSMIISKALWVLANVPSALAEP